MEEALRESEEKYRLLIETTDDFVFALDPEGKFIFGNAKAIETFGDLRGKPFTIPVPPEYHDLVKKNFARRIKGEKVEPYPIEVIDKKGNRFWVEVSGSPLIKDGKIICAIYFEKDITERKRAEEALRRSHNLLAAISRAQSHFIIDTDPHVLFDKLLSDMLSLTQSEYGFIGEVLNTAKGEPYLKTHTITNIAWNEETRALYEKYAPTMEFYNMKTLFGAVITTGKPVIANNPSTDPRHGGLPKGHPLLNAFLGLPFYSGKRLVGMAGIANRPGGYDEGLVEYLQPLLTTCGNIIEAYRTDQLRKHAEEETKKTRDYLQTIITSMKDGVLVINKDYVITDANQVAAEMAECGREKMVGRHCYEVIRGESQPCKPPVVCELREVLKTGEPIRVTHTLIDSRGGKHIVEVVASPIKDERGEVVQIVDIARDVTKEMEAENKLKERVAELERMHKAFVGRELRMKELKEEIKKLKERLGER